jgi:tryptophan 2,3-dioxygenase
MSEEFVDFSRQAGALGTDEAGLGGDGDRQFGEEGARLTYGSYLRVAELLSQQVPETDPPAHDEMLFIVVHQAYELWFKQLLHELEGARRAMDEGRLWWARHLLRRVGTIEGVLVHQIDIIETMTPQDFLEFRHRLAPASGFQSVQFRELEFLSGHKDPGFLQRFKGLTPDERARLDRRLAEPTVWDAFVGVLRRAGLPCDGDAEIGASLVAVARDRSRYGDIWELAEGLLVHDEQQAAWRARHVTMVERQIGTKSGTGGSSGAPYLRSRLPMRFYPLLWEMRGAL